MTITHDTLDLAEQRPIQPGTTPPHPEIRHGTQPPPQTLDKGTLCLVFALLPVPSGDHHGRHVQTCTFENTFHHY